jgi:hypothetical protein
MLHTSPRISEATHVLLLVGPTYVDDDKLRSSTASRPRKYPESQGSPAKGFQLDHRFWLNAQPVFHNFSSASLVCRLSSVVFAAKVSASYAPQSRLAEAARIYSGHRGLGWPVSRTAWQIKQATASMHTSSRGQEYSRANSFADIEQYYHVHCSQYHPLLPCYADRHTQRGHSMCVVCARQARVNSVPGYLPPAFGP